MTSGRPAPTGSARAARAYLRTETGHRIELVSNRVYVFGRSEACDLRLDDPGCSRRHAKISVAGDASNLHLEDLGSKNGTFRNEKAVRGRVQLKDGDQVRIGATVYEIRIWPGGLDIELDTRTGLLGE